MTKIGTDGTREKERERKGKGWRDDLDEFGKFAVTVSLSRLSRENSLPQDHSDSMLAVCLDAERT